MTHRQDQPPDERALQLHERVDDILRQLDTPFPSLQSLDPDDAAACRLWRACELCSFLDHRSRKLAEPSDPHSFSDADIDDQARRTLIAGERLSDPREMDWYQPYWLVADAKAVGTIALQVWNWGWCGLARPRVLAGESPAWVIVSREPSIEPCGAAGNRRVDA
jgi:hypothetical protein